MIPSISNLLNERNRIEKFRKEMFKNILSECVQNIKDTNPNEKTYLCFSVPGIIVGEPSYDKDLCVMYIIRKLQKKGYYVRYDPPNILYIDWGVPV